MAKLTNAILEQTAKLPRLALRKVLKRKLTAQEVELDDASLDTLIEKLLSGEGGAFHFGDEDGPSRNISLVFDDDDMKEVEDITSNMTDELPAIIERTIERSGKDLFKSLKASWQVEGAIQRYDQEGFRERLEERWSEGLELLRMLLTCVREIGAEVAKRHRRSKSKQFAHRRFVLMRLHIRACQVAEEIITLMENGFADGAMARWRTLYEIDVTATVIEDGDEDLALRYVEHDIVEVKKQADDYDEKQVPLGYSPIGRRERKRIEKSYDEAIRKFGVEFRNDYGWAANHLKIKRPTFKDLQSLAKQSSMNTYYKLANFHVHAGARAMFFRLSSMDTDLPIAGRSNAGLVEPGQNTAYTLVRITGALLGRPSSIESIIEMKSILLMRDAIPPALRRADQKLRRDEAIFQADQKAKAEKRRAKRLASGE